MGRLDATKDSQERKMQERKLRRRRRVKVKITVTQNGLRRKMKETVVCGTSKIEAGTKTNREARRERWEHNGNMDLEGEKRERGTHREDEEEEEVRPASGQVRRRRRRLGFFGCDGDMLEGVAGWRRRRRLVSFFCDGGCSGVDVGPSTCRLRLRRRLFGLTRTPVERDPIT